MSMGYTMQNGYEPIRASFISIADPSQATRVAAAKLSDVWEIGPEANAVTIAFGGEALTDTTANYTVWAWRVGNPIREFVLSGKVNFSDKCMYDNTLYLYASSITMSSTEYWYSIPDVIDSGNDRVARLAFDPVGCKYFRVDFTDVAVGANSATSVQAYGSYF